MATGIILHPLAQEALRRLRSRMRSEESREASDRRIVSALVYGTTSAQAAGMLDEFVRAVSAAETEEEAASSPEGGEAT